MEILKNIELKDCNTFAVHCITKEFVAVKSENDVIDLVHSDVLKNKKIYVLGMGANTVFVGDFDGLVIKNEIYGKEVLSESDDEILIKVGAGECWYDFVVDMASKNFVGMENLAYIPSSVGATAVQNIGAYGSEAKDIIDSVEGVFLSNGEKRIYKNIECKFGYRESIFKSELAGDFLITSVVYRLEKYKKGYEYNHNYAGIDEKIKELGLDLYSISPLEFVNVVTEIRKGKLPDWKKIGTAGSFFKNPVIGVDDWNSISEKYPELKGYKVDDGVKLSAGQLIDMCGFKGKDNGKIGTYKNHALILVNLGGGEGKDVLEFSTQIQNAVKDKFGIFLEPEAVMVKSIVTSR